MGGKSSRLSDENDPRYDDDHYSSDDSYYAEALETAFRFGDLTLNSANYPKSIVRSQHEIEHVKPILPEPNRLRIVEPKDGSESTGVPIALVSNYFPITSFTNWTLYRYRVDFSHDECNFSFKIKKRLLYRHSELLGSYMFDGRALYSSTKYESEKFELKSRHKCDKKNQKVLITISFVTHVSSDDNVYMQVFNLLLNNCLSSVGLKPEGRNWINPRNQFFIKKHELSVWPGYETTVGMVESGLLLRVETTFTFIQQESVFHYYTNCMKMELGFNVFQQKICGTTVLATYNNKIYKVLDVDGLSTPNSTFLKKDGTKTSYVQFYKEKWNLTVKELNQPMLLSKKVKHFVDLDKDEEHIYIVPEFCRLIGLSDNIKNDSSFKDELAKYTPSSPPSRVNRYNEFMKCLETTPDCLRLFDEWNLKLGNSLVKVSGRVLPPEDIQPNVDYNKSYTGKRHEHWTDNLRDVPMYNCAQLKQWHVVYSTNVSESCVSGFITTLQEVANKMAFMIPEPSLVQVRDNRTSTYINELDTICNQCTPSFILCIVKTYSADIVMEIKKMLYVTKAIPSHILSSINVNRYKTQCAQIAIEINAKLGGVPWYISVPYKEMMIIGFDVCDDQNTNKSYGALVATMNETHTSYYNTVHRQYPGDTFFTYIAELIISITKKYRDKNQILPSSIVVYSAKFVQKTVVTSIKNLYKQVFKQELSMAFVIVDKKTSTKFFTKTNEGFSSPPPGTVIDKTVTDLTTLYDFYLISYKKQFSPKTVTPTYYNVLEDSLKNWSPDKMQKLTFQLTHMYFNSLDTIRVPAPCQLAHDLALLSAEMGHVPNAGLNESLFYL